VGSIVSPGLATVETGKDNNLVDSFTTCAANGGVTDTSVNYPPSVLFPDRSTGSPSTVIQGPTVAIVDPTNNWLFVANRESNNVVVMPAQQRVGQDPSGSNVSAVIELSDNANDPLLSKGGHAPDGLALSKDGRTLFVYSQLDHELELVRQRDGSSNAMDLVVVSRTTLAGDTLATNFPVTLPTADPSNPTQTVKVDLTAGRKMFFSARDPRISSINTGIACSSCHVDGREDGHTWQFPDGPRRTPQLAGRALGQTAPYHWTGIFPRLTDFYNETLIKRMGGTGLTEDQAAADFSGPLTAYLYSMPAPENPLQNRPDLADVLAQGKAAFHKATCDTCHSSGTRTDDHGNDFLTDNLVHDVGTITSADQLEDTSGEGDNQPLTSGFNTPSLLGLGRTAPYLHDGSVVSISQRLAEARSPNAAGIRHGDTSQLTNAEMDALAIYLGSL
jgi:mono/diheme cytochrome c family protein